MKWRMGITVMTNLMGKKFLFGIAAIICVSATSCYLKYAGDVYIKLVSAVAGLFMLTQGATDIVKRKEETK